MYKNKERLALVFCLIWISLIFSAFKGFHFWYAGFLVFFWLSLGFLNYRHETSLWLLRNRTTLFLKFVMVSAAVGFIADYLIGIKISHFWNYPFYNDLFDWVRLYLIIYPFGGLSILELVFFLSGLSGDKLYFIHKTNNLTQKFIDASDYFVDIFLLIVILLWPLMYWFGVKLPIRHFFAYGFLVWLVIATVKFAYHIKHGWHWVAIFLAALLMSLLLNEYPNTVALEWVYYNGPILNYKILELPVWVMLGWYVMILFMMRLWIRLVWAKKPHIIH